MMKFIYAGIGSRETPDYVIPWMTEIAAQLSEGWILRSGHAQGADMAFENGCTGEKEIYLPWEGFNNAPSNHPEYGVPPLTDELLSLAAHYHPNWNACSKSAKKMHARNMHQIMGVNLDTPCHMVICWTKGGKQGGGTGQALRLANALDIPVFDLFQSSKTIDALVEFTNAITA
jgi:hypothetical protein